MEEISLTQAMLKTRTCEVPKISQVDEGFGWEKSNGLTEAMAGYLCAAFPEISIFMEDFQV